KSSAARQVAALVAAGVLVWTADRRLAPGPAFAPPPAPLAPGAPAPANREGDPLEAALDSWASGYDPLLARAYGITTRLLRLAREMERQMAASAAREGMRAGDVLLLDALYRVGPPHRATATELKHHFLMTLAGIAKRVDRLEALGFIARPCNPGDGRGRLIALTDAGQAALARMVARDQAAPHICWPMALPDREYAALAAALARADALLGGPGAADAIKERSDY
ncbi:MAG TPA: MarR family transcriptional regulator, partial [Novosphingobium sp.]|nr:MarR family transcriptional regulator [Novosphingobium sp.]